MYEVAERFYRELIPQAREMAEHAAAAGERSAAQAIDQVIDEILARPEHLWFEEGAEGAAARIREAMQNRYDRGGQ
jgi:hypothetical protein